MSEPANIDERVQELESRLVWQDDTIEQLNAVIREQWNGIERLLQRVELLEHRLLDVEDRMPPVPVAPPPHY
jgi:SlyX protein